MNPEDLNRAAADLAAKQDHGGALADGAPVTRRASSVRSRSLRWAWDGRVPLRYLTAATGREGVGKSILTAWMLARWTHGELRGDLHGEPADVLLLASEDGIEDTWMPRLALADADLDRVHFFTPPASWTVDKADVVQRALQDTGARIVVVEAVYDHLPSGAAGENANSAQWVRAALRPLKSLMEQADAAGIFTMHPPKGASSDPRTMFQGSQAWSAVPRTTLIVEWHPDDRGLPDHDRRRVLVRGKGNIGKDPVALQFTTAAREFTADDGITTLREFVNDVQVSDVTRERLLQRPDTAHGPTKVDTAAEVIARELPADDEWHPSAPIWEALRAVGIGKEQAQQARSALAVRTRKSGFSGGWEWSRPQTTDPSDPSRLARGVSEPSDPSSSEDPKTRIDPRRVGRVGGFGGQQGSSSEGSEGSGSSRARGSDALNADQLVAELLAAPELSAVEVARPPEGATLWMFAGRPEWKAAR